VNLLSGKECYLYVARDVIARYTRRCQAAAVIIATLTPAVGCSPPTVEPLIDT